MNLKLKYCLAVVFRAYFRVKSVCYKWTGVEMYRGAVHWSAQHNRRPSLCDLCDFLFAFEPVLFMCSQLLHPVMLWRICWLLLVVVAATAASRHQVTTVIPAWSAAECGAGVHLPAAHRAGGLVPPRLEPGHHALLCRLAGPPPHHSRPQPQRHRRFHRNNQDFNIY